MIIIKEINKRNTLLKIIDEPYPVNGKIGTYKVHVKLGELKSLGELILEKEYNLDSEKDFVRDHDGFWIPNSAFSCHYCLDKDKCNLAYDLYNQDGDCLAVK